MSASSLESAADTNTHAEDHDNDIFVDVEATVDLGLQLEEPNGRAESVYNAAKNGNLQFLERVVASERAKLGVQNVSCVVSQPFNKVVPLAIASKHGQLDCVRYLLQECKVDIHSRSDIISDTTKKEVKQATPLWIASTAGQVGIVRYLVENGANVNSGTETMSTPLRGASFHGHLEIMDFLLKNGANINTPNHIGQSPIMIAALRQQIAAVKLLLLHQADIHQRTQHGYSALHMSASKGNVELLKLLLDAGARNEKDNLKLLPMMLAAANCHTEAVHFFMERYDCATNDAANALELCGATAIDREDNIDRAMGLWEQAIKLRMSAMSKGSDDWKDKDPPVAAPCAAYDNFVEASTEEELATLVNCSDFVISHHALHINSLLIRERVLGALHPHTSYYINLYGSTCTDNHLYKRALQLWTHALNMERVLFDYDIEEIQEDLLMRVDGFEDMLLDSFYPDVTPFLEWAIDVVSDRTKKGQSTWKCHAAAVMLASQWLRSAQGDCHRLGPNGLDITRKLVRLRSNPDGCTSLHLAVDAGLPRRCESLCEFPDLEFVQFLLGNGSDPNCLNAAQHTSLHIAALNQPSEEAKNVIDLLLDCGAAVDIRSSDGCTPIDLYRSTHVWDPEQSLCERLYHPGVLSLQSLAAARLAHCGMSLQESGLTQKLKDFVRLRCTDKDEDS
ncbi:protein fem-1 homolog C-like [Corticium candelabrum]|uniref:protein fem-1 homolog C-like n=1 Tax=Corticium candelabrum TaxID=121492 RepID=UPI002E26E1DC|nr:protein fem-1 homolog C-like [Corticium candelabrum]